MRELKPFNQGEKGFSNMLEDFFSGNRLSYKDFLQDTFKIDVEETPTEYQITADLPGIKKEEITLDINEERLTIAVRREEKSEEQKKEYIHRERKSSSMSRSIYLDGADSDKVTAKLAEGLLSITIGKDEKAHNAKTITIES